MLTRIVCTISVAYLLASISYYIITRFIGTPLADSLNKKQQEIKKQSVKVRGSIFAISIAVMIMILLISPLKLDCA